MGGHGPIQLNRNMTYKLLVGPNHYIREFISMGPCPIAGYLYFSAGMGPTAIYGYLSLLAPR